MVKYLLCPAESKEFTYILATLDLGHLAPKRHITIIRANRPCLRPPSGLRDRAMLAEQGSKITAQAYPAFPLAHSKLSPMTKILQSTPTPTTR